MLEIVDIIWSDKLTKFSTKDRIRIQIAIYEWLYDEIDTANEFLVAKELQGWKLFIHESSESNLREFQALVGDQKLDIRIPHGITIKTSKGIHVFVENRSSYAPFFGGIRQAFTTAISHEIAHAIVSILVDIGFFPKRLRRKYRDKLNPAGTEANTEVVLVHDRIYEQSNGLISVRKFKLPAFIIGSLRFLAFQVEGVEIRDWVN